MLGCNVKNVPAGSTRDNSLLDRIDRSHDENVQKSLISKYFQEQNMKRNPGTQENNFHQYSPTYWTLVDASRVKCTENYHNCLESFSC